MTRRHILALDDEPMVTDSIRRILSSAYDVTMLNDARRALELVTEGARFDAIICDVMMPGLDGMRFYEQLRAIDTVQAARIVFLSGASAELRARDFFERVPNRRLEKPFAAEALVTLIDRMLARPT